TSSITVNAAGAINVTGTTGNLTIAATSTSGGVTLISADSIRLGGDLNAGSGQIVITADTNGLATAGAASYDQAGYSLITTNSGNSFYGVGPDAVTITVNPSGGLGDAIIGMGSIGSNLATNLAEITVNANGGNILWSNDAVYLPFGGAQTGLT